MQRGVLSPEIINEFLQDHGTYLKHKYGLKRHIPCVPRICRRQSLLFIICRDPKGINVAQIYAKHSFSFTLAENTLEIVDKYKKN